MEPTTRWFPSDPGVMSCATHVIAVKQLLEQKEMQENVEKAFGAVTAIKDYKLGPSTRSSTHPRSPRRRKS
jgi:hypothetical protein